MELKAKYDREMRTREELDKKDERKKKNGAFQRVLETIPGSEPNSYSSS